jgi:hypothetical protein
LLLICIVAFRRAIGFNGNPFDASDCNKPFFNYGKNAQPINNGRKTEKNFRKKQPLARRGGWDQANRDHDGDSHHQCGHLHPLYVASSLPREARIFFRRPNVR